MLRIEERKKNDEYDEDENEHDGNAGRLADDSMTAVVPPIFLLVLQHLRVIPKFKVIGVSYWWSMKSRITMR